jgi:integrase
MAKAKKLPSGNWRVNLYIGKENGKRLYKSFTAPTRAEAELMAAKYKAGVKECSAPNNLTVGEAIDKYIEMKSNVLSPTTIREYKRCRNNDFAGIIDTQLSKLTNNNVQICINDLSANHSPKFVKNAYGLLSATLKMYYPDFRLNILLPQKKKIDILIPSDEEVKKLIEFVKGKEEEVPIVLGAFCGLRRSEIVGLKWDCIDLKNNTITIKEARVRGENNEVVAKSTKTTQSTRTIKIYPFIAEILKKSRNDSAYVTNLSGDTIYNRYTRALELLGIQHYRFHDLRHYVCSAMLALNIPKNYIAAYLGHGSERMVDMVYGHIMKDKKNEFDKRLEDYFNSIMQHEMQHIDEKTPLHQ